MKSKSVIFLLILFFGFSFVVASPVFAESFYAQLEIKEVKSKDNIIFSFDKATALYGNYDSFFNVYQEENKDNVGYILKTYGSDRKEQSKYQINSSRFTFVDEIGDNGELSGGVIESNSGVIKAVIPYDRKNPTAFVKIDNNGKETDFMPLPTEQLEKDFAKIPLCTEQGKAVDILENQCCSGLIAAPQEDETYICINCGDSKCSQYEDKMNCPTDCLPNVGQKVETTKPEAEAPAGNKWLLYFSMAFGVIALVIFIAISIRFIFYLKNRKNIPPQY